MKIVQISSEISPIAKVGGLADVVFGLSKEFVTMGHDVTVILPKYDLLQIQGLDNLDLEEEFFSSEGAYSFKNSIWKAELHGIHLVLIEPHHPRGYFERKTIYGCLDDVDRFLYFCIATLDYLLKNNLSIDVVQLHDWMTAGVALFYKELYENRGLKLPAIFFTIHNLAHQGLCASFNLTRFGLRGEDFLTQDKLEDPHSLGSINLLKAALQYADHIVTVSPNYAREIISPEGGCGLDPLLRKNRLKLSGILNGIDELFWDPKNDPHLVASYSFTDGIEAIRNAKESNKKELYARLKMKGSKKPLIGCVSRLVPQKGCDLIAYAIEHTLDLGGQFVLLGSSPIPEIQQAFCQLKKRLKKNRNVSILLAHDEAIAHLIFASSDLFIIPSLFEPCGLTQLIALRYGTVPIARETGGLVDTVFDLETSTLPYNERNGFTFLYPDQKGIDWGIDRAFTLFQEDPKLWGELMLHGMGRDLSWKAAAEEYLKLFEQIRRKIA